MWREFLVPENTVADCSRAKKSEVNKILLQPCPESLSHRLWKQRDETRACAPGSPLVGELAQAERR